MSGLTYGSKNPPIAGRLGAFRLSAATFQPTQLPRASSRILLKELQLIDQMTIKGTVRRINLEGGFWAILASDGRKYRPVEGLPASFQREGLQVEAAVAPSSMVSIFMWGRAVRITQIKEARA